MKNFYKTNQVKEQTTFVQNQWDNFKLDVGGGGGTYNPNMKKKL